MLSLLPNDKANRALNALYDHATESDPAVRESLLGREEGLSSFDRFSARRSLYMPVHPELGKLMYGLMRSSGAKTVVEFGTSFGISTAFLAAAAKENGGCVLTTEFIAEKSAKAKQNLMNCGLAEWVDFRIGDALTVMRAEPLQTVDFVFLDGEKSLYLDFFKLAEPHFKRGTIIAADNTDHDGVESFLDYVRSDRNRYVSSAALNPGAQSSRAYEITIRI